MNRPYTVTKDINADLKKLITLVQKGIIKIFQVKIESPTPKIKNINLPNAVWDHTNWDESLFSSESGSKRFEKIKNILGGGNIKDAIHLDTHIREKRDYFVTEDNNILQHKRILERVFNGLKIRTTDELVKELDN